MTFRPHRPPAAPRMLAPALQRLVSLRKRIRDEVRLVDLHLLRVERIADHRTTPANELVEMRVAGGLLGSQLTKLAIILGHAFARRGQLGFELCKVMVAPYGEEVEKLVFA